MEIAQPGRLDEVLTEMERRDEIEHAGTTDDEESRWRLA